MKDRRLYRTIILRFLVPGGKSVGLECLSRRQPLMTCTRVSLKQTHTMNSSELYDSLSSTWRVVKWLMVIFISGPSTTARPDPGQTRQLPSRDRQGGSHQTHDHRCKTLQAWKPSNTPLLSTLLIYQEPKALVNGYKALGKAYSCINKLFTITLTDSTVIMLGPLSCWIGSSL